MTGINRSVGIKSAIAYLSSRGIIRCDFDDSAMDMFIGLYDIACSIRQNMEISVNKQIACDYIHRHGKGKHEKIKKEDIDFNLESITKICKF